MTISTLQNTITVSGNGSSTVFQIPFVIDNAEYIQVVYTNSSGIQTTLSSTQYLVAINAPATGSLWGVGGFLTYPLSGSPIASGTTLTISRILPLVQDTSLSNVGNFYTQVTEEALDTVTMQIQQTAARTGLIRGTWISGGQYNYSDIVTDGANGANTGNLYSCAIANTSGIWATDLANGYWTLALNVQSIVNGGGTYLPLAGGTISGNLGVTGTTTAATLSVTGSGTVAGNLSVTGTTTVSGALTAVNSIVSVLSPTSYGASTSATGSANATAFAAWWTALKAAPFGTAGFIPAGTYNIASGLTWDYGVSRSSSGIYVFGAGMNETILNFTNSTGTSLQIESSTGTSFYDVLKDIGFYANTSGVAFKIGLDALTDYVFQNGVFENVNWANTNTTAGSQTLRINGVTAATFLNTQITGGQSASAGVPGVGIAVEWVQPQYCTFITPSWGNANIALQIDDNGNASGGGFVFGNVVLASNFENIQTTVKNTSPNASRNRFINGTWFPTDTGGYQVSSSGGSSTSGGTLVIQDVHMNGSPLYGTGSTGTALDPSNQVGVIFTGGTYGRSSTPSFPVSAATYTNNTGQTQLYYMTGFGTMSSILINTITVPSTIPFFILAPGDTVKFTYTGSPSWYMTNVVN